MSWSISVPATPAEDFGEACDAAFAAASELNPTIFGEAETNAQAGAALAAAVSIVKDGLVGKLLVSAELSGHANPGHEPRPGWSHDQIRITVGCAEPYPER